MTANDAPILDGALIAALRADLAEAGWTVDALEEILSDRARAALAREQRLPALIELEGRDDPASVLTRLFVLGSIESEAVLVAALPRLGVRGARALGLVAPAEEGGAAAGLSALFDLRPYAAMLGVASGTGVSDDAAGEVAWWIASDIPGSRAGGPLRPDHVLGVGGASTSLLEMTIRDRVDSALDMGCGCGIQAMHLTTHARRVVATDLSARACAFTRFNAALNGLDIEVREGSLFEPVAGEAFDLIVTNPPFVITPDSLRGARGLLEYRDGGMSRDGLVRTVVRSGPEHLVPGGILQLIGNWEIPAEHDPDAEWGLRLEEWFEGLAVDAWIVERDVLDPARYIEMWLQDADPTGVANEGAYRAWLADFDAAGVGGIGMGFMAIRRHIGDEGAPVLRFELGLAGARPRGADVARTLRALRLPADLAPQRLERAEDVTEERHYVPGSADPQVMILHQGSGLGRSIMVGTAVSALVGASDGELEVGQIIAAVAMLTERDADEVRAEIDEPVRGLLRAGMLRIVGD
ncbi:methyltransferase [Schaalia hyovaginalis]|uniref:DUF7059 domain-containing protein n=1 Tax=Schaalia hyovaginalis TaxID=29316 RepID=UPI002A802810|nr:methyltransferase [Schaalia hyovaginalis]MDY3665426.1 methyltransferase [Schaalia hyovaginalis]